MDLLGGAMIRRTGGWAALCIAAAAWGGSTGAAPEKGAEAEIARLVAALGDRRFPVRDAAQKRLVELEGAAIPALERARSSADPEVAEAALQLLSEIQGVMPRLARMGAKGLRKELMGERWFAFRWGERSGVMCFSLSGRAYEPCRFRWEARQLHPEGAGHRWGFAGEMKPDWRIQRYATFLGKVEDPSVERLEPAPFPFFAWLYLLDEIRLPEQEVLVNELDREGCVREVRCRIRVGPEEEIETPSGKAQGRPFRFLDATQGKERPLLTIWADGQGRIGRAVFHSDPDLILDPISAEEAAKLCEAARWRE